MYSLSKILTSASSAHSLSTQDPSFIWNYGFIRTPCETPLGKNPNKLLQLSAHMHPSPALFQARDMAVQALSCAFTAGALRYIKPDGAATPVVGRIAAVTPRIGRSRTMPRCGSAGPHSLPFASQCEKTHVKNGRRPFDAVVTPSRLVCVRLYL